jgi:uncharacterized heparinase superfamily protein
VLRTPRGAWDLRMEMQSCEQSGLGGEPAAAAAVISFCVRALRLIEAERFVLWQAGSGYLFHGAVKDGHANRFARVLRHGTQDDQQSGTRFGRAHEAGGGGQACRLPFTGSGLVTHVTN